MGLPAVVRGVSPGPGHRVVLLDGQLPDQRVRLLAHLGLDEPAPSPGDLVSVRFDAARSAVMPAPDRPGPPKVTLTRSRMQTYCIPDTESRHR